MKSTQKLRALCRESQQQRKAMLEEAFKDALRAKDAGFAAVVAAQLRQYVGRVHHA
jgi:predicted transcriptional regulator